MARRTKEEAQETRCQLLDAAEQVFSEKGVAHTSLADVAAAAGLTRGAIENSEGFAGSDGLFRFHSNGAIERGLAILQVAPTGATAVDGAPRRFSGPSS